MASKSDQKYELQNPVFPQEFRYMLLLSICLWYYPTAINMNIDMALI